ncbi:MAG: undecaprenyl-phosphate glucose phosphotransferase [Paludibacter sp.]
MKSRPTELLFVYLFLDLFLLNAGIIFTAWFSLNISLWNYSLVVDYILQANLAWILTYFIFPKKNLHLRDGFYNRFKRITIRIAIFILVSVLIQFIFMPVGFLRMFFLEFTFVCYILKILAYWLLYIYLKNRRLEGFHTNRALIIGVNDSCRHLRKLIDSNPILGYNFVGFVTSKTIEVPDVLGKPDQLGELIDKHKIQIVFITLPLFGSKKRGDEYMKICNEKGVRIRLIPENQRWLKSQINLESVGDLALINPQEIPLDDLDSRFFKRTFDLLFSTLFLVLIFSWLFPIVALLIKLSSKGPVLFVQKRTGINNVTFNCYKFRSMNVNGLADTMQATANDNRITHIGKFMRRTNIDELPQFVNVFLGQMSVVGPRPHMLKHTNQYSKLIDHYLIRHYVKPGITGWAQVNGLRGETDELWKMEKRVEYDMEYIENWSLWWDVKIILMTVFDKKTYENAG